MSGVNRQGQAHIMSTAIVSPRSGKTGGAFRTWFSIDPQPASISPTINISIGFMFEEILHRSGTNAISPCLMSNWKMNMNPSSRRLRNN
jgi:hypothetical protein